MLQTTALHLVSYFALIDQLFRRYFRLCSTSLQKLATDATGFLISIYHHTTNKIMASRLQCVSTLLNYNLVKIKTEINMTGKGKLVKFNTKT